MNYDFSGVDAAKNDKDLYGLRYSQFVIPLIKSVQELSQKNDDKDAKITDLQKQIDELKTIVMQLKNTGTVNPMTNTTELEISSAKLEQNAPNPFNRNTTISYFLPQSVNKAMMQIVTIDGKIIKAVPLTAKGKGQLIIKAGELAARYIPVHIND